MARDAAIARAVLAAASVACFAALLLGGDAAEYVLALTCATFPPALIVLGASRRGRCGRGVLIASGALFAVLGVSLLTLFLLRGRGMDVPMLFGVPLPVVVLLGGIWLVPLAFVGLVYALTFESHGISEEDLRRLRALGGDPDGAAEGREDAG